MKALALFVWLLFIGGLCYYFNSGWPVWLILFTNELLDNIK